MKKSNTRPLFDEPQGSGPEEGQLVRVALNTGADSLFDYVLPTFLGRVEVGQRVQAPFGKADKLHEAFVVEAEGAKGGDSDLWQKARAFRLKCIKQILDSQPLLDEQLMELARWISEYYVCPLGQTLAAMVPAAVKKDAGVKKERRVYLRMADPPAEILKSKPQKALTDALQKAGALDEGSALSKDALLADAGCTDGPLKQLARKQIVKIIEKTILAPLPAAPKELLIQARTITLNEDQQKALNHLDRQIENRQFAVIVLHGVTDSGKTEVDRKSVV